MFLFNLKKKYMYFENYFLISVLKNKRKSKLFFNTEDENI